MAITLGVRSSRPPWQVQGLGTRLMNRLKMTLLSQGTTRIVTYADNYALPFFLAQSEWLHIPPPAALSNREPPGNTP